MPTKTYRGLEKGLKKVVETDIKLIKINEDILIRTIDPKHVIDLVNNIKECGQISPIIIEEYKPGLFWVVAHAHEFTALQRIYEEVREQDPAITFSILTQRFEGDEYQRKLTQLSENITHKPMTREEIGEQVAEILSKNKKVTQKEIAERLGWSQSHICECLGVYKGKQSGNSESEFQELTSDTPKRTNGEYEAQGEDDPDPDQQSYEPKIAPPQAPIANLDDPTAPSQPKPP